MGTIFKSGIAYLGAGGGNANQEELTWDEYEALTEEEKTNGTVYYITDADEIEPDKFRPVIYSEDEREIGVWTDGKPLYQKTAFVTPGNTISMVGLSLKHGQCYSINTSGGIASVPYNDGSYTVWWMSNDAIRFATQHNISQYVITYQYTKDSDFAGSGKWTPQGVPAHHYSTDEHVIGTWVDGNTLYEKVVVNNSTLVVGNNSISIPTDAATIVSATGIFISGTYSNPLNYYATSANGALAVDELNATSHTLRVRIGSDYSSLLTGAHVYITIHYTKTTS